jgi:uncharacterized protein YraI
METEMNLKKTALKAGLAAALLFAGTAATVAVEAFATGGVNVRRGPGTNYGVVDQLRRGESVDVRGCSGGWCQIVHSGPDGWVSASYLSRGGDFYDDDDDVDVDVYVGRPYRYDRPRWRPRYRDRDNFVCFGGNNARFCLSD